MTTTLKVELKVTDEPKEGSFQMNLWMMTTYVFIYMALSYIYIKESSITVRNFSSPNITWEEGCPRISVCWSCPSCRPWHWPGVRRCWSTTCPPHSQSCWQVASVGLPPVVRGLRTLQSSSRLVWAIPSPECLHLWKVTITRPEGHEMRQPRWNRFPYFTSFTTLKVCRQMTDTPSDCLTYHVHPSKTQTADWYHF